MVPYPQPIPDNALDESFPPLEYQKDFADTVGNAGTPSDGFETIYSLIASHAADLPGFLAGFDSILGELGATVPGLGTALEGEAQQSLADAISNGQPAADTLAALPHGPHGRVWSGAVMTFISYVSKPIVWQDGADAKLFFTWFPFGTRVDPRAGEKPFPFPVAWHNPDHHEPIHPASVELSGGDPIFERIWHETETASVPGIDWNMYLDINPSQAGTFRTHLTLTEENGTKHTMSVYVNVQP